MTKIANIAPLTPTTFLAVDIKGSLWRGSLSESGDAVEWVSLPLPPSDPSAGAASFEGLPVKAKSWRRE
jgi:hypothetical protein